MYHTSSSANGNVDNVVSNGDSVFGLSGPVRLVKDNPRSAMTLIGYSVLLLLFVMVAVALPLLLLLLLFSWVSIVLIIVLLSNTGISQLTFELMFPFESFSVSLPCGDGSKLCTVLA